MATTPRGQVQTQGTVPLANTVSGAAGTVLGSERALIHTHANKALLDTYTQTNANIGSAITNMHTHANKALLDTYTQSEALLASAVSLRHAQGAEHANLATLNAITAAYTSGEASKLAALYYPVSTVSDALGSEVILGNSGYTQVIAGAVPQTTSRPTLVSGHITFRNFNGSTTTGYFRVRHTGTGAVLASGQLDIANNQRGTIGFSALWTAPSYSGEYFILEARISSAGNCVATNVNGIGDVAATRQNVVPVGA